MCFAEDSSASVIVQVRAECFEGEIEPAVWISESDALSCESDSAADVSEQACCGCSSFADAVRQLGSGMIGSALIETNLTLNFGAVNVLLSENDVFVLAVF